MGATPWMQMYEYLNSEGVQYQSFSIVELLQSSSIHTQFIPEFHSGLITFNYFVVIHSFSADPTQKYVKAVFYFKLNFTISMKIFKRVVQLSNFFSYLCSMEREIVTFGTYFDDFLETLPNKVVEKIDYIFLLLRTEERITQKFIKHLTNGL